MVDLGVMTHSRPRPTYKVAVPEEWQREAYFPRSNRKKLAQSGATLAWRVNPWLKVDGYFDGVKYRQIQAAAFDSGGLVCFLQIQQVRNGLDDEVGAGSFSMCLDDDSEALGAVGAAIAEALMVLEGRNWVEPGETFSEVCTLFVPATHKCKVTWAEAINELLSHLARRYAGDVVRMLCLLKVWPLEEWWRVRRLDDDRWQRGDAGEAELMASEREITLGRRRRRAMKRMYERQLHFEGLQSKADWMARVVHI